MASGIRSVVCNGSVYGLAEQSGDSSRLDEHPSTSGLFGIKHWMDIWCLWLFSLFRRCSGW